MTKFIIEFDYEKELCPKALSCATCSGWYKDRPDDCPLINLEDWLDETI